MISSIFLLSKHITSTDYKGHCLHCFTTKLLPAREVVVWYATIWTDRVFKAWSWAATSKISVNHFISPPVSQFVFYVLDVFPTDHIKAFPLFNLLLCNSIYLCFQCFLSLNFLTVLSNLGGPLCCWLIQSRDLNTLTTHSSMPIRPHLPSLHDLFNLIVLSFGCRNLFSTKRCLAFLSISSNSIPVQFIKTPLNRTISTTQVLIAVIRLWVLSLDFRSSPNPVIYALLGFFFTSWFMTPLIPGQLATSLRVSYFPRFKF